MQRAAIYARVSTPDQCIDNQLYELRELAARRGYEIVHEYTDVGSGSKARRAGLDALLADAPARGKVCDSLHAASVQRLLSYGMIKFKIACPKPRQLITTNSRLEGGRNANTSPGHDAPRAF